jgi:DNA helicase-2/ATP-dependent DNA helicase PcrA
MGDKHTLIEGLQATQSNITHPEKLINKLGEFTDKYLSSKYERWNTRKKDFDLLAELAKKHKDIHSFLETYTLDPMSTSEASRLEQEDCVTLITVHSAKGTECPVCYLLKAEAGMYPHVRSMGDEEAVEEERRILYVAMTRAQNELILTRGLFNSRYGNSVKDAEEYFLEDIPSYLVEEYALENFRDSEFDNAVKTF